MSMFQKHQNQNESPSRGWSKQQVGQDITWLRTLHLRKTAEITLLVEQPGKDSRTRRTAAGIRVDELGLTIRSGGLYFSIDLTAQEARKLGQRIADAATKLEKIRTKAANV